MPNERIEEKVFFGKVIKVTDTRIFEDYGFISHHSDKPYYIWNDEPSIFWLTLAMIYLRTAAIFVPAYGWIFWKYDIGFFGRGCDYFQK